MKDAQEIIEQLIAELAQTRQRIAGLEQMLSDGKSAEQAIQEAREYAESIVATVREPLLILDASLRVISVNRSFYETFGVTREETEGYFIFDLGDGQWDIPGLRELLEEILPKNTSFHDFVVDHNFPTIGHKVMLLNARRLYNETKKTRMILLSIQDITQRKEAEELVAVSETRYRRLFETAQDGIIILNADTECIIDINPFLVDMLGYSHGEFLGKKLWEIGPFRDVEASKLAFQELQSKEYVRYENLPLETMAGEQISVEFVSNVYEVDHMRVIQCNIRNITERRQMEEALAKSKDELEIRVKERTAELAETNRALVLEIATRKKIEEKLRESEERFRQFFENEPEYCYMISPESTIKDVNRAACEALGYNKEELIGKPLQTIYAPESLPEIKQLFEKWKRTGTLRNEELTIISKDGNRRTVLLSADIVKNQKGEVLRSVSIQRDITERKQAEEALRESEERWRTLTENSPDTIMVVDIGGKIEYINRTIPGLTNEQIVGTSVLDHLSGESADIQKKAIVHVIQTGKSMQYQLNYVTPEGNTVVYESSIGPVVHDGKIIAIVISIRDITERIRLEEELQKAAKLESVGTLAGGIAHDFNNLLTGIMGNIGLAKRYVEPKGKASERLDEAERASIRARDLTQQMLTFSRGGAPIKKPVAIAGLVKESANFSLRGSNIMGDFSIPDDLRSVEVDEGQINQVFNNIIINAVQAMPTGGIINIGARNLVIDKKVHLPLSKGNYVEVVIEDHGTGIPKKHLERIFEPYFTTKQKGSGLGLATAYSIIKNHGGYISVESTPTVGTTFHVYLPATKKRAPKKEEEGIKPILLGEGKVLVMDDEDTIRKLLYAELTEVGYEVQLTNDGAEAIERYSEAKKAGQPFDAVILDLTVPGSIGGKEAIKKLLEIDPDVKAVVSSGYATDPIMADYKKYGFNAVVTKPYSVGQLEKTLHSLFKKK